MDGSTLPFLLIFVSTVLVVISAYNYFARERVARKAINRRVALLETNEGAVATLDVLRRERGIFGDTRWPAVRKAQDWLTQSGLRIGRSTFWASFLGFALMVTAGAGVALDFAPIALPIGIIASVVAATLLIRYIRARRIATFSQQLPEVLEMIVRSLRSGHPLTAAFALVAKEMRDPAGSEFGMLFDEIAFGLDVPSAVKNLARRVGDPDLLYLVTSISVQAESGGNLAEILERLSKTIRERQKLRLKVGAMTAEGRTSGIVLTALPVIVFFVVSWISPSYFGDVWDEPAFVNTMRVALAMLVTGHFIMQRLVNFKY